MKFGLLVVDENAKLLWENNYGHKCQSQTYSLGTYFHSHLYTQE